MELTHTDVILRRITIFSFIPSFACLLPYGIMSGRRFVPTLSLIPMGFSLFSGLYFLSGKARSRVFNCLIDIFLAAYLFAMWIASCVLLGRYQSWYWRYNHLVIVGTYGTVPVMISFFIHFYFALQGMQILHFIKAAFRGVISTPLCPHCRRETLYQWGVTSPDSSSAKESSYVAVPTQDNDEEAAEPSSSKGPKMQSEYKDARPSTDDENARLV